MQVGVTSHCARHSSVHQALLLTQTHTGAQDLATGIAERSMRKQGGTSVVSAAILNWFADEANRQTAAALTDIWWSGRPSEADQGGTPQHQQVQDGSGKLTSPPEDPASEDSPPLVGGFLLKPGTRFVYSGQMQGHGKASVKKWCAP